MTHTPSPSSKVFRRSRHDRMLVGVCGGLAERTGVPAWLVRTLFVVGLIAGLGSLAVVYVVLWWLVPQAD
jgi:phage shock protein C